MHVRARVLIETSAQSSAQSGDDDHGSGKTPPPFALGLRWVPLALRRRICGEFAEMPDQPMMVGLSHQNRSQLVCLQADVLAFQASFCAKPFRIGREWMRRESRASPGARIVTVRDFLKSPTNEKRNRGRIPNSARGIGGSPASRFLRSRKKSHLESWQGSKNPMEVTCQPSLVTPL
jgi:hypothetical protein